MKDFIFRIVAALRKASLERIQFMYGGRFKRLGSDIKVAILILSLIDCQPHMCDEENGEYIVAARCLVPVLICGYEVGATILK